MDAKAIGAFAICLVLLFSGCALAGQPPRQNTAQSTPETQHRANEKPMQPETNTAQPASPLNKTIPAIESNNSALPAGNKTILPLPPPEKDVSFHICPLERKTGCTKEYDPVCARALEPTGTEYYNDYGNPCTACSTNSNAIGYFMGTCASRGV